MRQAIIVLLLLVLMQVVVNFGAVPVADAAFDARTLVSTGFMILAAYALGELFRRFRLPALLGYLAAGIVFGPELSSLVFGDDTLAPLSSTTLHELGLVNILAVGVIGTMGGGEIKLAELRENFGKLAAISGTVLLVILPVVAGTVLGLSFIAPSIVPFLADLPVAHRLAAALLLGALAVGMSPAATLALLQEVHAHGRFTSLVLGIVVLGDLVLVATFLLMLALAKLLISPEGFSVAGALEAVPHIAAEFGWALLIGLIVGLVFILYLRFVRREVLLFSLAVVFVTSFIASRVHAETLLAFLIAGFVVQNFSRHGHDLVEAFERIALPVFVIYFAAQAAALDLVSVTVYLPLALILIGLRVGLLFVTVGVGARMAGVEDPTKRNLQVSFFSQGGVDLVLAAMIAEGIPGWGTEVQTVTMATVLVYVIGGPPLLARALDRMGESAAARERGTEQLADQARSTPEPREAQARASFPAPSTDHPELNARLETLHALVLDLAEHELGAGIRERAATRKIELGELAARIAASLEFDTGVASEAGELPKPAELRERMRRLDVEVTERARTWPELALTPFDRPVLEQLLAQLTAAQPFSASLRVIRDGSLFTAQGSRLVRLLRALRRIRRAIVGPGTRTVPLGRLWRYHVTLEVPVSLWGSISPREALAWHRLLEHYQITRSRLAALADGDWKREAAEQAQAEFAAALASAEHTHDHSPSEPEAAEQPASVVEAKPINGASWLAGAVAQARVREAELLTLISALDEPLEDGFRTALAQAWTGFLNSVELAGTLEMPAWRYRPSRRYDAARAATEELRERSDRDREAAAGRRDGLRTLVEARSVATLTHASAEQLNLHLEQALAPVRLGFDRALITARTLDVAEGGEADEGGGGNQGESALARGRALIEELEAIRGTLEQTRRRLLEQRIHDLGEPGRVLTKVPDLLAPSVDLTSPPDTGGRNETKRTPVRLRAWLGQTLARELGATLSNVGDELTVGLDGVRVAVHYAREVLDYHLHSHVNDDSDSLATPNKGLDEGLGERIAGLIERARAQLDQLTDGLRDQLETKLSEAEEAALEPLLSARWDEVRRRSRRLDEPGTGVSIGARLRERGHQLAVGGRALARRVSDEFGALLSDRPTPGATEACRQLLFGSRSSMPEAYQRLFTSVPAESIGLLVDRPELTPLCEAICRAPGPHQDRSAPILVWGERGAGKRTLIRQALGERERAQAQAHADFGPVHWLRLSPTLEHEPDVARELATILGWPAASDLAGLLERVRGRPALTEVGPRQLLVLENAERLFRRTPEGLDSVRHLLDLIAATGSQVHWVVLMVEAGVRVLDPALELRARFSLALHVPPVGAGQVERVLDVRHRLSGYSLRRMPGRPTAHEWLRQPASAWRRWRDDDVAISERLTELSGGNLRQALRLWLAAARLDPHDPTTVIVGPLPSEPCQLTHELPLSTKLLLGSLLLYGPMLRRELESVHGWARGQVARASTGTGPGEGALDLDAELTRLAQLGLVIIEGGDGAAADASPLIRIETRLAQPLACELRAANLL